jgi:hypothetical protein
MIVLQLLLLQTMRKRVKKKSRREIHLVVDMVRAILVEEAVVLLTFLLLVSHPIMQMKASHGTLMIEGKDPVGVTSTGSTSIQFGTKNLQ